MALICTAPPLAEPVSLPELKLMLRMDPSDTSQDDVLTTLNIAARSWCETITQRRFVQQTWSLFMDYFPGYIDLKLAGQKVSSPFVSGSNAVLVGIRYAIVLPYPPVQTLNSFDYQNANGEVTSMILGPETIASVTNTNEQPISIETSTPHNLITGSTVTIAGNSGLLSLLGGEATQVITVTDDYDFTLNGTTGTGSTISAGGTVTGYNFVEDLISQPARLTPVFGQMWPVARVVVNAIEMNYTSGYATPITVTTNTSTAQITSSYTFSSTNVGQPISIPGASSSASALNTIIQSVSDGVATVRDQPGTAVTNTTSLLVNYGNALHWEIVRGAIKLLVNAWFVNRVPNLDPKSDAIRAAKLALGPAMDMRF
jgi:hypothetical protein